MKNDIKKAIKELCEEFKKNPYQYFTENDLVCALCFKLQKAITSLKIADCDEVEHSLVHTEYATPFRCDMRGSHFKKVKDDARTEYGKKFKRGHYDLIVLNPDFIKKNTAEVIQGQNYEMLKESISKESSIIYYGIEVMFSRREIKESRGKDPLKGIEGYCKQIDQDLKKLEKSIEQKFMKYGKMLVFFRGTTDFMKKYIEKRYKANKNVCCCFI